MIVMGVTAKFFANFRETAGVGGVEVGGADDSSHPIGGDD